MEFDGKGSEVCLGACGGELEAGVGPEDAGCGSGGGSSDAEDGGGKWGSLSKSGGGFCARSGESAQGLFELFSTWKVCFRCDGDEDENSRDRGGVQSSESHS